MGYIGAHSEICIHGDEQGKCEQCYDIWRTTGQSPQPVGTFKQVYGDASNLWSMSKTNYVVETLSVEGEWVLHERCSTDNFNEAHLKLLVFRKVYPMCKFRLKKYVTTEEVIG